MNKILSYNNLNQNIEKVKSQGKIVLVGGCFDVLHAGHIAFLEAAKKEGNVLIVLLESDASIKIRKGENRPINIQEARTKNLSNIPFVDFIIPLPTLKTDKDYYKLTNTIKPDIIAITYDDPLLKVKQDQAKMVGGRVVSVIKRDSRFSTTNLLQNNKL